MKNEELKIEEDAALAAAVRQAFDVGEVPERLRLDIHAAAEREWATGAAQARWRAVRSFPAQPSRPWRPPRRRPAGIQWAR